MNTEILIRPERPSDIEAVHAVNTAAFEQPGEAGAVDAIRAAGNATISLVALRGETLVGHILFSPVTVDHKTTSLLGLAPMAVHPDHQRRGVGGALVKAGLEACREAGAPAVVVLGHVSYYPRFGFVPSLPDGLQLAGMPGCEAFMVVELTPKVLEGISGEVRYDSAFDGL